MEVRSYYATTVEAAISLARKELGPEAMLIQSQPASPEHAHLGRYEVVFAGELQKPARPRPTPPKASAPLPKPAQPGFPAKTVVPPPGFEVRSREAAPELGPVDLVSHPGSLGPDFASLLESAGVDRQTSREFFDGLPKHSPPKPLARKALASQPAHRNDPPVLNDEAFHIDCNPTLGRDRAQSTVALVGPPGSGKTLTIMKLGIQSGLAAGRHVRLIALDPHRVCGTAQLQSFAALLDLDFHQLDSFAALQRVLVQPFSGLTLIDTPGYSRSEAEPLAELGILLDSRRDIETHLTLRADLHTAGALRAIDRYSVCSPKRLILTALDETETHSELRAVIEAARLPLSFLGTGPRVPEDLEAARPAPVANLIARGWSEFARAAA